MEIAALVSTILAVVGALIGFRSTKASVITTSSPTVSRTADAAVTPTMSVSMKLMVGLAVIAVIYAMIGGFLYWNNLKLSRDTLFYGAGLFIVMIAGMFIQIVVSNIKEGKDPKQINALELVVPLLLSFIVFYSLWLVAQNAPRDITAAYNAFINGYFWRTVTERAQPPDPKK